MAAIPTTPTFFLSQIHAKSPTLLSPSHLRFSLRLLPFPPNPSLSFPSKSSLNTTTTTAISCTQSPEPPPATSSWPKYMPNRISYPTYIRIFDTTLRDGEQSPRAALTSKEKLVIARQLAKLGVDIIEAGFPAASKDDFEAVRQIAKEVGNAVDSDGHVPVICGLSRCIKNDIDTAWEAVKYARRPRIHTFIATSEIHLEHKLRKSRYEVVEIARNMVKYARSLGCDDVEFSPEDTGRLDLLILKQFAYHYFVINSNLFHKQSLGIFS